MTRRTCPLCQRSTGLTSCCGIDLTVRRKRWQMTPDRIRFVHILALTRKGLTDEQYRLRLGAVGVESSKQLNREQYQQFVDGLNRLPDAPNWRTRQPSGISPSITRSARG